MIVTQTMTVQMRENVFKMESSQIRKAVSVLMAILDQLAKKSLGQFFPKTSALDIWEITRFLLTLNMECLTRNVLNVLI